MTKHVPIINGRRLTDEQNERLIACLILDASEDKLDRDRARAGLTDLRREIDAANLADQVSLDLTETVALRRKMGEFVEVNIDGVWCCETALLQLYMIGKLNGEEIPARRMYEVGIIYADCYEKIMGLRTAAKQEVRGAGGGAQEAIADAAMTIANMRFGLLPPAILALDRVCGMNLTPYEIMRSYKTKTETTARHVRLGLFHIAKCRS